MSFDNPGRLIPAQLGALPGALPGRGLDPAVAAAAPAASKATVPLLGDTGPSGLGLVNGLPFQLGGDGLLSGPSQGTTEPPARLDMVAVERPPLVGSAAPSASAPTADEAQATNSPWLREASLAPLPPPTYVPPPAESSSPRSTPRPANPASGGGSSVVPIVLVVLVVLGGLGAMGYVFRNDLKNLRRSGGGDDDSALRIELGESERAKEQNKDELAPKATADATATAKSQPVVRPPPGSTPGAGGTATTTSAPKAPTTPTAAPKFDPADI